VKRERVSGCVLRMVRIAYVVKCIWADYCSGCSGPVYPVWDWGEQKERKKGIEEDKRRD